MEILPYFVLGLVVGMVVLHLFGRLGLRRLEGKPAPVVHDLLGAEAAGGGPALYYFFSQSCGPCRQMSPVVERQAAIHPGVQSVDIHEQPELARRFGIVVVPTLVLVTEGRVKKVLVGRTDEARLQALLG
jgi:thioredoxin 1